MSKNALKTDLYEVAMAAAYVLNGMADRVGVCEAFVRRLPLGRKYLVAAGHHMIWKWLDEDLRFGDDDIHYFSQVPALEKAFQNQKVREAFKAFEPNAIVRSVPEGSLIFPNEPIFQVVGSLFELTLIETYLLSAMNYSTTIATKAARIVHAAKGVPVIELGSRRTHPDAAVDAAYLAVKAGCKATSNLLAGRGSSFREHVPVTGTMAHMWVMANAHEDVAFSKYLTCFPDTTLLIDTYDVTGGAVAAISAAFRANKGRLSAVRIDSGDLVENSIQVRKILNAAGFTDTKIVVSGDLNEDRIGTLIAAKAPIDGFGVGTDLVTSPDAPTIGGVYKLVAIKTGDRFDGVSKKSAGGKETIAWEKQIYRSKAKDRHDWVGRRDGVLDNAPGYTQLLVQDSESQWDDLHHEINTLIDPYNGEYPVYIHEDLRMPEVSE